MYSLHPLPSALAGAAAAVLVILSPGAAGQTASAASVEITISPAVRGEATTGRIYVALSRDNKRTPIQQAGPTGSPLFSKALDAVKPGTTVSRVPIQRFSASCTT